MAIGKAICSLGGLMEKLWRVQTLPSTPSLFLKPPLSPTLRNPKSESSHNLSVTQHHSARSSRPL